MRRPPRVLAIALLCVLAIASAAGCAVTGTALDGTSWKLTEWSVSSVSPTAYKITARFAKGEISGISAVNQYSGHYAAGPGNTFSVGTLSSTLMAGPDAANRAEIAYTKLLSDTKSYKVDGNTLTLFDAGGNVSLVFERAP